MRETTNGIPAAAHKRGGMLALLLAENPHASRLEFGEQPDRRGGLAITLPALVGLHAFPDTLAKFVSDAVPVIARQTARGHARVSGLPASRPK